MAAIYPAEKGFASTPYAECCIWKNDVSYEFVSSVVIGIASQAVSIGVKEGESLRNPYRSGVSLLLEDPLVLISKENFVEIIRRSNITIWAVPAELDIVISSMLVSQTRDARREQEKADYIHNLSDTLAAAVTRRLMTANSDSQINATKKVFVAMPMSGDPLLPDILNAIKTAASSHGLVAERVDDRNDNVRITFKIIEMLREAEYVVADLTHLRPNVLFEAGFAEAIGKTPIYIARNGTSLPFDINDYPVISFDSATELQRRIGERFSVVVGNRCG